MPVIVALLLPLTTYMVLGTALKVVGVYGKDAKLSTLAAPLTVDSSAATLEFNSIISLDKLAIIIWLFVTLLELTRI